MIGSRRMFAVIAVVASLGLGALMWILSARAGDERVSSTGAGEGVAAGPAPSFGPAAQTNFPRDGGPVSAPPSSSGMGLARDAAVASAPVDVNAAPAPVAPSEERKAVSDPAADEKGALAAGGLPTDPKGLAEIGLKKRMLIGIATRMMNHPAVVKALFNNKYVVDAMMSRDDVKRSCSNQEDLGHYLSDQKASQPMFQMLRGALNDPAGAAEIAQTDLVSRIASCPSLQAAARNPASVVSMVAANPAFFQLLTDPRSAAALSSNAAATAQLSEVQSSMSGGIVP